MVLIVATLIVFRQTEYMRTADMGFKHDTLVWLNILGGGNLPQVMKEELLKHAGVSHTSISHTTPIWHTDGDQLLVSTEGLDAPVNVKYLMTDHE